jgi:hypothetical protein
VKNKKVGYLRVGWNPLAPLLGLLFIFPALPLRGQGTSTAQNPTVTFSSPGPKQVTLQACNAVGCTTVTKTVVVLDPMPQIINIGSVPALVGAGQTVALSAQTAGRPALTHRWTISGSPGNLTLVGNPAAWNTQTPGIGTYQVRLEVQNVDGSVFSTPVSVQVERMSFADVSPTYWAWQAVETLYARGITGGCATAPMRYCPTNAVSRAEMAAFLVKAMYGTFFTPPAPTGIFADVDTSFWGAPQIEQIYRDGISSGCALSPLRYCPTALLKRGEMAVFLLRAKHGSSYVPPPATGTLFADVSTSTFAAAWIEQLYREGITAGCTTSPVVKYCPDDAVQRDQMALFLVKTFNLTMP